jgi:hypothetical protein
MISNSPDRGSFQIDCELKQVEEGNKTAEQAEEMIEFYRSHQDLVREREAAPEWREHNMEYDLRATDWIVAKARASEAYAQNLYAAMCNNDFQQNAVWPVLKNQTWSASWRYAGGIIADMRGEGDYMDWYCSGIKGGATEEALAEMTPEQLEKYHWYNANFVSESYVTDEIRADLLKLGWIVVDSGDDVV